MITEEEFKILDSKGKSERQAHDYTFPELPDEVTDFFGKRIRKVDAPQVRFLAWQKSVQAASRTAGVVKPVVLDYFINTRHLIKPPTPGDLDIQMKKPLEPKYYGTSEPPRFTWSPSRLISFEQCGERFAQEYYYKTIPYTETVHTLWGSRCHKAIEQYMTGERVTDQEAWAVVKPYAELFARLPGERLVEYKVAVDGNWKPCDFEAADYAGRMIIDFAMINGDKVHIVDWKSGSCFDKQGNVKTPSVQLEIYAYIMAIHFPKLQTFECRYVSLKDKQQPPKQVFTRRELIPVAQDIRRRLDRLKEAWESEVYRAKPSGLCKDYCGATGCVHNGKRR